MATARGEEGRAGRSTRCNGRLRALLPGWADPAPTRTARPSGCSPRRRRTYRIGVRRSRRSTTADPGRASGWRRSLPPEGGSAPGLARRDLAAWARVGAAVGALAAWAAAAVAAAGGAAWPSRPSRSRSLCIGRRGSPRRHGFSRRRRGCKQTRRCQRACTDRTWPAAREGTTASRAPSVAEARLVAPEAAASAERAGRRMCTMRTPFGRSGSSHAASRTTSSRTLGAMGVVAARADRRRSRTSCTFCRRTRRTRTWSSRIPRTTACTADCRSPCCRAAHTSARRSWSTRRTRRRR